MRTPLPAARVARRLFVNKPQRGGRRNLWECWERYGEQKGKLEQFVHARFSGGISWIRAAGTGKLVDMESELGPPIGNLGNAGQARSFLGCGDGEEGNVLSKSHKERRVMGYSPEQLFAVVAAVDLYEDFLPWCQRSKIIRRNGDGSFDAELEIGFKFLVESYISHVELKNPRSIKSTVSESGIFEYLINVWEFNPGPIPGTCDLHFLVDFKFQSPLYRQVATMFFKEVVSRLVGSFSDRCCRIYGPGVDVIEKPYGQGI